MPAYDSLSQSRHQNQERLVIKKILRDSDNHLWQIKLRTSRWQVRRKEIYNVQVYGNRASSASTNSDNAIDHL